MYMSLIFAGILSGVPVTAWSLLKSATYSEAGILCIGPEIADAFYPISQSDCQTLCNRRAGCVNVQVYLDGHCSFHGQCEHHMPCNDCVLFQNTEAIITKCYWDFNPFVGGKEYLGTISHTASGSECLRWDGAESFVSEDFADLNITAASNYCRNPVYKSRPFCLTDGNNWGWDYCDVPICQPFYSGGYEVLKNYDCESNDIKTFPDTDAEHCEAYCEIVWSCAAFVVSNGNCFIKDTCKPMLRAGATVFIRADFPGWSLYMFKKCTSLDLAVIIAQSPYDCLRQCIDQTDCVAAAFLPQGSCVLKAQCDWLVESEKWHTYRMLDVVVAGYEVVHDSAVDSDSLTIGDVVSVTSVRQCAALCEMYKYICGCFEVNQVEDDEKQCVFYFVCSFDALVSGSSDVYFPQDFDVYGLNVVPNTWCNGPNIATEFPSVADEGECASLCRYRQECMNAVFDFFRNVCYLKAACDQKEPSMHHDLFQKPAHWSEWSDPLLCGALEKGYISQQRTCMYGENCEGDNTRCYEKCHPLMTSYGKVWKGKKLLDGPIHILTTKSVRQCLSLCQRNCICNAYNYRTDRFRWVSKKDNCELLYFTYEDVENALALDIDYRFALLYGLESIDAS